MANGYWDRILRVDLSTGKTWEDHPGDDFFRSHVGGRSFIAHYLLNEVPAEADPLGPDNRLIFMAGAVTGVPLPGAGRHSVGGRSPLTGGFGEAEAGGFWGAELKHAGYDGIIFQGRAERPVYLWIDEQTVELRDAEHLWGRQTGEVEASLREAHGDRLVRVCQIGPAGENLVKYACVVNDLNEVAGRTGLGAVMGSKNLKAIAVRGKKQVPMADPARIKEVAMWVARTMDENHYNFHHYGTGAAMVGKHLEGHLPVRNWQEGTMETVNLIDAQALKAQYIEKMDGCYACSVRCKKRAHVEAMEAGGVEVLPKYGGAEYETLGAVGTNLGIDNLVELCKANQALNWWGMDSVSTGATIAWAMECYQRGILTEEDTGGLALEWGDGELLNQLIDLIAKREGIGDLLAEGALRAARKLGRDSEQYVVHVKGLEIAMHDPRAMEHMKTNYPVNPTGGDHTGGAHPRTSIRNTIGVCQFLQYDEPTTLDILNAVTGWGMTEAELDEVYHRGVTMARLFNLRCGFGRDDDKLPPRFHEPLKQGPFANHPLTREEVARVVEEYYETQGWDRATGAPTAETLDRLKLREYATA
ncbi:MAG: aldehyde ferredoxin oxidoreductase family protein [Chloroflexi bacterium]|nr:aldehyde ferredoxin oxidoreductase family protein [Chloroflexota bacterium]